MEKQNENLKSGQIYLMLLLICTVLLIGSLFFNSIISLIPNFLSLQIQSQRLYTDSMIFANRNGAMLNSAMLGIISLGILLLARVKPNGITIAGVFLIMGFGFAGMTCLSILPIIFGTWIYAKIKKQRFRDYANEALLSFALTPVVNEIAFGEAKAFELPAQIIMSMFFGIIIGLSIPPLANQMGKHNKPYKVQYELLAVGIVSFVFFSAYKSVIIDRTNISTFLYMENYQGQGSNYYFYILMGIVFISFIVIAYFLENRSFKEYKKMFSSTYYEDDFVNKSEFSSILINIGIIGIISLIYFIIIGVKFNGIVVAALFISIAMACLKVNPLHIPFILLGLIISERTCIIPLSTPTMLFGYSFSLGLVALVKHCGIAYGVIAGIIFNYMNIYADSLVAGLNLYNSGAIMGLTVVIITFLHGAMNSKPEPAKNNIDKTKNIKGKTIKFK